jgi:hypothetical protein
VIERAADDVDSIADDIVAAVTYGPPEPGDDLAGDPADRAQAVSELDVIERTELDGLPVLTVSGEIDLAGVSPGLDRGRRAESGALVNLAASASSTLRVCQLLRAEQAAAAPGGLVCSPGGVAACSRSAVC